MQTVFLLQHLHVISEDKEDVKIIGIYNSRESAEVAVTRLRSQPGFNDFPDIVDDGSGFYIDQYYLDKDHWAEGYEYSGA